MKKRAIENREESCDRAIVEFEENSSSRENRAIVELARETFYLVKVSSGEASLSLQNVVAALEGGDTTMGGDTGSRGRRWR